MSSDGKNRVDEGHAQEDKLATQGARRGEEVHEERDKS